LKHFRVRYQDQRLSLLLGAGNCHLINEPSIFILTVQ
jgi:hypothetical protein